MSDKFDFLNDVAVIELVNQISIAKEKSQEIKKGNSLMVRALNIFTGATDEHQNDFNAEVSGAIELIKDEILNSNKAILKNSNAIKKISEVLIQQKHTLRLVESDIEGLKSKVSEIETRLKSIEGQNAVDQVVASWSRKCDTANNPLFEFILLIQMLYWSDFTGAASSDLKVRQYGYDRCWEAIHQKFNLKESDFIRQVSLAKDFDSLPKLEKDALDLMLPYVNSALTRGYKENRLDSLLEEASLSRVASAGDLISDLYESSFNSEVLA
jgi:hypothetical protein